MSLSKTVALVTGGSSGLGAATVQRLLQQGARVLVADITSPPHHVLFHPVNVTEPQQIASALDLMEETFGEPLNVAINCAGMAPAQKILSSKGPHDPDLFLQTLMVNTMGTFHVCRLAAERMATREPTDDGLRGCLINTASIAAMEGQMGQVAYASSKAAVVGMTLPMARDLAPKGIRVVTIAPGLFETPLLAELPPPAIAKLTETIPCPSRLGRPDEFASLVTSIIGNSMLNGTTIRIDGGTRLS